MIKIKKILEEEIKIADNVFVCIEKYPEMFQPHAEIFWRGRKTQSEELLGKIEKIISSSPVLSDSASNNDEDNLDDEDNFVECSECDGHDACRDFGCAIELGLGRMLKQPM